jgi:hypothetical protein
MTALCAVVVPAKAGIQFYKFKSPCASMGRIFGLPDARKDIRQAIKDRWAKGSRQAGG